MASRTFWPGARVALGWGGGAPRGARRDGLVVGRPARQLRLPAGEAPALEAGGEGVVGTGPPLVPRRPLRRALRGGLAVEGEHVVGHPERLVGWDPEDLLGDADLVVAERVAVRGVGVGELGGRVADVAAQHDERRLVLDRHAPPQRGLEGVAVVGDLAHLVDVPAVAAEARGCIVGEGQLGLAVDRDVVVVVDHDEPAEAEVAGERGGLVADALHEVAVTRDHEGVVVAQLGAEAGAQPALGDRHAGAVADALAERAGGDLDALGVVPFGVARRLRLPLAERLEVVELQAVPGQVEHRVEEDRRVAGGEDEPVAVGPVGLARVVLHHPRPEHVGEWRQCHRRARVPGVGPLRGVHREASDDVDPALLQVARHPCDPTHGPTAAGRRR
jgi:hypothetical protein